MLTHDDYEALLDSVYDNEAIALTDKRAAEIKAYEFKNIPDAHNRILTMMLHDTQAVS